MNKTCARCQKVVYPIEELKCLDKDKSQAENIINEFMSWCSEKQYNKLAECIKKLRADFRSQQQETKDKQYTTSTAPVVPIKFPVKRKLNFEYECKPNKTQKTMETMEINKPTTDSCIINWDDGFLDLYENIESMLPEIEQSFPCNGTFPSLNSGFGNSTQVETRAPPCNEKPANTKKNNVNIISVETLNPLSSFEHETESDDDFLEIAKNLENLLPPNTFPSLNSGFKNSTEFETGAPAICNEGPAITQKENDNVISLEVLNPLPSFQHETESDDDFLEIVKNVENLFPINKPDTVLSASSEKADRFSDIICTSDDESQFQEYSIMQNKISNSMPNISLYRDEKADLNEPLNNINGYGFKEGEFLFTPHQMMYLNDYYLEKNCVANQKEFTKCLEDMLRTNYKQMNNVCSINVCSHGYTKNLDILRIYAICIYKRCRKYKFILNLKSSPIEVQVFSNKRFLNHESNIKKNQQLRGFQRKVAKCNLKHQLPSNYRDGLLNNFNKLNENIPSKSVIKKMKSEGTQNCNRHKDMALDVFLMQRDKEWKNFIQKVSMPQEIYLFSQEQFKILSDGRQLLKRSRNTLFFDATGSVIKKIDAESKRVFLYSLVLHVREDGEKGIVLPIAEAILSRHFAEDIERFLMELKVYCSLKKFKWPLCKRICCDFSWAIINAVVKTFDNIDVLTYLKKCYIFLNSNGKISSNFVVIQICYCHFIKICFKDINIYAKNEEQRKFFRQMIVTAINISNLQEFWMWLRKTCVILKSTVKSKHLFKAKAFMNEFDESQLPDISEIDPVIPEKTLYKKSPFYIKGQHIIQTTKVVQSSPNLNELQNLEYLDCILKKYVPYLPWWTNVMGKFAETENKTRISNAPVEGYFNITKNVTLEGKRNVRPTQYIRKSKKFIQAKLNDLKYKFKYQANIICKSKNSTKLVEDVWRRTPKRITNQGKNLYAEKATTSFDDAADIYSKIKVPEHLSNVSLIILEFNTLLKSGNTETPSFYVDLCEFQCLNPRQLVYSNVIEIYISVLFLKHNITNAICFPFEVGMNIFNNNPKEKEDILKFDREIEHIIMPIYKQTHYTFVYLNLFSRQFQFIDPQGATESVVKKMFESFKNNVILQNPCDWNYKIVKHFRQNDGYNCGVLCCQFAEAIIANNSLEQIMNPNKFRTVIKNDLIAYGNAQINCLHCYSTEVPVVKCLGCGRGVDSECLKKHYSVIVNDNFLCHLCHL